MGEYVIRPLLPVRSPTESLATFLVRLGEYFDLISNHERGIKPDTKLTNYILINASTGLNLIQKSLNDTRIWTLCMKSGLADCMTCMWQVLAFVSHERFLTFFTSIIIYILPYFTFEPDRAIVPRLVISSSRVSPMPVSCIVNVLATSSAAMSISRGNSASHTLSPCVWT